ncbi:hypothetical protein L4D06_06760 [Enterovibrio makurazakiensis]|uniref:hypothetical protein n=1 Tax=Enterovibrio makurazakiensis TaxID=2910232 RepID=UPI003D1E1B22
MFEWFNKTFATAAQQATLFSIVVSTILAVSLLLLNQWFSTRKDNRNLRIVKLEEFATAIYSYERLCLDILSRLYQHPPTDQLIIDKMVASVEASDRIEMLSALYFPTIPFDPSSTQSIVYKVHRQFDAVELNQKTHPKDYISYADATQSLIQVLSGLKSSVKLEMKKYT